MRPKLIIHGGFFSESQSNNEVKNAKQLALSEIAVQSHDYLMSHTALETAVFAASLLEDCDLFNAGLGSQIQSDGRIRLSAGLMDGRSETFSGVINIEHIRNPILLAHKLMAIDDHVLSGQGALEFARQNGFGYFNPETKQRREEFVKKLSSSVGMGTVGCVALDGEAYIAAATSTGGKGFELPGRVSDSATTAGNYANRFAGISCTGVGEDIINAGLAVKIVTRVTDGLSLEEASLKSFEELKPGKGFAGMIGISSNGEVYHCDSHPYMVWAAYDKQLSVFS